MKVNKKGCAPTEDVCMAHHRPLICRHGCEEAIPHRCGGYGTLAEPDPGGIATYGKGPDPRRLPSGQHSKDEQ